MYLSLPLKYRPLRFEDLIGQEVSQKVLSALIKKGQLGRHIILHGAYGSSKTTSARIYARALNCLSPTPSGSPCNECENCQLFFRGAYTDYIEFDGASKGRIDSIKEVVEIAKAPPMQGRYRVITIDEAQGLTKQAWDVLLKILEEPPAYLVFLFTTTEVGKIREAVVSRCQSLEVSLLSMTSSVQHLRNICSSEGLVFEEGALALIAFLSKGHPRDLLKNLELVTFLGDVTEENAKEIFNVGFVQNITGLFMAILSKDLERAVNINRGWQEQPKNKLDFLKEFLLYLDYAYIEEINVHVNPVFEFLVKEHVSEILKMLRSICSGSELSLSKGVINLLEALSQGEASSAVAFELILLNMYNFFHSFGMNASRFGIPNAESPRKEVKEEPTRRGRVFVEDYQRASSGDDDDDEDEDDEEEDKRLDPNSLVGLGFEVRDKTTITKFGT